MATSRIVAPTQAAIIKQGTIVAKHSNMLPKETEGIIRLVKGKVLGVSLHEAETTPIPENSMKAFRAAVADAVAGPGFSQRCPGLVYQTASVTAEVDPDLIILKLKTAHPKKMVA